MSTAHRVSLKIIKNKIKRTLTLLTVLRLSPIAYEKEIQELEQKLERYRQKYMDLKVKELRG
jgi:predicted aldo/keto reductase-like oxidoreductase